MKNYDNSNEFKKDFGWLGSWLSNNLMARICDFLDKGTITINAKYIKPKTMEWDGELLINVENLSNLEIVNGLIQYSSANEIFMTDEKTLRLWWD